jgi:hypothetical protein
MGPHEETIDQTVQQEADGDPNPAQDARARGVGSSSPGGEEEFSVLQEEGAFSCAVTVNHHIENGGGSADTSRTDADPPCSVNTMTSCTSAGDGEPGCVSNNCPPEKPFNPETGRCEEPPEDIILSASRLGPAGQRT